MWPNRKEFNVCIVGPPYGKCSGKVESGGRVVNLGFWDIAGQEDYDRLRPLSYPRTDMFVICVSLVDRASLEMVESKFVKIREQFPEATIFLVGTKMDLRKDPHTLQTLKKQKQKPVDYEEGLALAARIDAVRYMECSALTQQGYGQLSEEIIRQTLR